MIPPAPYYREVLDEKTQFRWAHEQRLPLLLKGPTGCGKSRFVEAMAHELGLPLVTVACHEDTSATDLLGRFLVRGGDTVWQDGPLTRAVRQGAILYLDEIAEAREDVVVVIHPLTDHRRQVWVDKIDEVVRAPDEFMFVCSYNPGYQRKIKELKPSTRQRFLAVSFDYPQPAIEAEIVEREAQIDAATARRLVDVGGRVRKLEELGLAENVSTRLLVYAAKLIRAGASPRRPVSSRSPSRSVTTPTSSGPSRTSPRWSSELDFSERSYLWALRHWRRLVRRWAPEVASVDGALDDYADRLEIVTAMVFLDRLRVEPADDDVGGVAGDVLLLPSTVRLGAGPGAALAMYRYRVAWGAASRSLGFAEAGGQRDPLANALTTWLAVPATRERLATQLPGLAADEAWLQALELARRPPERVNRPGGLLEALVRQLLGDPDPFGGRAPPGGEAWLREALAVRPRGAEHLRASAAQLVGPMLAISGRSEPPPPVSLWGRLLAPVAGADAEDADTPEDDSAEPGATIELDRTLRLRRTRLGRREDRPLYHMFEKLETAEEYGSESATPDASGSARQMREALRELSLGTVIRTPEAPRNLVRARVIAEPTGLEVGAGSAVEQAAFRHPEWDHQKSKYREDWCTVREQRYLPGDAGAQNLELAREILRGERRHVDAIRGHLLRTLYRRQVRDRQTEGPEIDVEAMVERHADLAGGRTPPDRLYLSERRALREVAILVLLDASWSTDAYIEGQRVLDLELAALLIVGEAFEGYLEEEVAVASFTSHTRNDVCFGVLKSFEDPWRSLRQIAPSLRPDGYTRIGAAIRHASSVLDAAQASKRLLLILSDGKPTDYDRYEGRYGIEDVRRAIKEARQRRIQTYGIAIEKQANLYLSRMLGTGHHRVLHRSSALPDVMADVFLRVMLD